jgi:hypothetical protein
MPQIADRLEKLGLASYAEPFSQDTVRAKIVMPSARTVAVSPLRPPTGTAVRN